MRQLLSKYSQQDQSNRKKTKAHNKVTKYHTMLVQDCFLERNYWVKQQSNTQKQGHLQLSKLAAWVLCMGHRAKQHSTGGVCRYSMKNIIWNVLKVMISTRK